MMYGSWDIRHDGQSFLSFRAFFYPLTLKKTKFWKMQKKTPGDIIILHFYITNYDSLMYHSWDVECDRQNFLSFWAIFCPFTPLTTQKIKILKKWKKIQVISSFYTSVPKIVIISYTLPDIWSVADRIFCHFRSYFALLPH